MTKKYIIHFAFVAFLFMNSLVIKAQTFDVDVIFYKMKCLKVVEAPFDTEEDIFGRVVMAFYKMKDSQGTLKTTGCCSSIRPIGNLSYAFTYWNGYGSKLHLGLNESSTFNVKKTFSNISYTQLMSLEFAIGGEILDDDLMVVWYQNCNECGGASRNVSMSTYKSQIDVMAANTNKFLKIGSDDIMELNFYEGDNNSSRIQCQFKIKVTKK